MKIVEEFTVPARYGRAVKVAKGDTLRIIDLEGQQVADLVFYNAHDYSEVYSAGHSVYLNMMRGTGDSQMIETLWSSPPHERVMLTVTDDKLKSHCIPLATCCSKTVYETSPSYKGGMARSCADNLMEALKPFNVPAHLPDVFNAFMNFNIEEWGKGDYRFKAPQSKPGDYIDFRAEIDLLVGISACPADKTPTNGFNPTSVGVAVLR